MTPLKIAVLVSGGGTNLQTLINAEQSGELPIDIVGVISNREDAYAIERAKSANIEVAVLSHVHVTIDDNHISENHVPDNNVPNKTVKRMGIKTFEKNALQQLNNWQPDLILLAGFMRVLSGGFINACPAPLINIHPSLLPNFKGLDTHARAIETYNKSGETQHGCSVHIVTAELDAGQVLTQAILNIKPDDTADSLQKRVHQLEYQILPYTIAMVAKGVFTTDKAPYLDVKQTDTIAECLPKLPWKLQID